VGRHQPGRRARHWRRGTGVPEEATTIDDRIESNGRLIAVLLIALGLPQLAIGLWALLAPHSFYSDFPAGAGWVSKLGPYSEHLLRDVGSLFAGLGVLLALAAVLQRRCLVQAAVATWLLFAVPHAIYHVLNLEPYGTTDAVANIATLAWTVLAPVIVLALLRRPPSARPPAKAPAG